MADRQTLLLALAETIADYRENELPAPTTEHVDRWLGQFPVDQQEPILRELTFTLEQTYLSRVRVEGLLKGLVHNAALAGDAPGSFWPTVNFLDIQDKGESQRDLLKAFSGVLETECGIAVGDCGIPGGPYVYLDDGLFTDNRLLGDLRRWGGEEAPAEADVHVVVAALHMGGKHYVQTKLAQGFAAAGKTMRLHWWRMLQFEDRRAYTNSSDVLRPSSVPDDELAKQYEAMLVAAGYPSTLRNPALGKSSQFFSSEEGRHVLEQEFLKAGVRVREMCPNLNDYQRPLGNSVLRTFGFGTLVVTYRNCPNNAPLALWVGDPWYPLFPRKTN